MNMHFPYQSAEKFLADLRARANQKGISPRKRPLIGHTKEKQLQSLCSRFSSLGYPDEVRAIVHDVADLAHRCKLAIPKGLWPKIIDALHDEYLRGDIKVRGTVATSEAKRRLFDELKQDPVFESFRTTPWIIKHAVNTYLEPRPFLEQVQAQIKTLSADPAFKDLAPSLLRRAATLYSRDPCAFLQQKLRS